MKILFFACFILGCAIITSCNQEADLAPSNSLDRITIYDSKGVVKQTFEYDRDRGVFNRGEVSAENTEGGCTTINGELISKTPNNDGGHNYSCLADNTKTCYTNCPQQ